MASDRQVIINRIDEIRREFDAGFSRRISRWDVKFESHYIEAIDYETLPADKLVEFFELIIRRYYKWM